MNSLDELFKNKLEDHSLTPSLTAWSKVEANLSKKNNTIIWFRIAACLALFSLSWLTYKQLVYTHDTKLMVEMRPKTSNDLQKKSIPPNTEFSKQTHIPRNVYPNKTKPTIVQQPVASIETASIEKITHEQPLIIETSIAEATQTYKQVIAQTEKPLVIEYTLEAVTDQPQEATSRSRLQKVVDFALDAKHSDGALTNLRQAKDDLFAFNFKKDKSKPSKN